MKYHLSIIANVFLSMSSVTLAFDPRAASLQRRKPEPGLSFWSCCRTVEEVSDPATIAKPSAESSDLADAPRTSTDSSDFVAAPRTYDEHLTALYSQRGPYPTQLQDARISENGLRSRVGVIAIRRNPDRFLLIKDSFNDKDGWRFPESDWGEGEPKQQDAVAREAKYAAGVVVDPSVPTYVHTISRKEDHLDSGSDTQYYQFDAKDWRQQWPGDQRWVRQWATNEEAHIYLAEFHPEQIPLLEKRGSENKDRGLEIEEE